MNRERDHQARRRARMVQRDLAGRGIRDQRVLDAMGAVPREDFVPPELAGRAYDDSALPIESGQTISQPFIVAAMAEAAEVRPTDRVLEIGTGSGYGAAVLARLAAEVVTIERHPGLAETAAARLVADANVTVVVGDGSRGWPDRAPYDAIVVTAAAPDLPAALVDQLADGGRLVAPVGAKHGAQDLVRARRSGEEITRTDLGPVAFVPLIGDEGW